MLTCRQPHTSKKPSAQLTTTLHCAKMNLVSQQKISKAPRSTPRRNEGDFPMPLVAAKCTECGANLQVDNARDAAICQFCGKPFIVEKAIRNNQTNTQIKAVDESGAKDFDIYAGKLLKYTGASASVVIPSSVTEIGGRAFLGCSGLRSVRIPKVKSIGESAFKDCKNLSTVIIADSGGWFTRIEKGAFEGCCELETINFPKNEIIIRTYAFRGCSRLTSINLLSVIALEDMAFEGCSGLRSINFPNGIQEIPSTM